MKHIRWSVILIACVLAACGEAYTFRGVEVQQAKTAPAFTLTDQHGQAFDVTAQRGNVVALFFGFTSCPDVCPTTLADLAQAREQLGNDAQKIKVVMVTVDPARDTQQRIGEYLEHFDPSFVGLTGSQEQIDPVLKAYGVSAIRRELPNSKIGYTMDHSASVYLIDTAGNWRVLLPFGTSVDDMARDLGYLARN